MKDLRIVFMGTPDFAVASLALLVQQGCTVVGVITAPDKPAGRGRKLQESAVKRYAQAHGLPLLQPLNLKSDSFLEELRELRAQLQVVVAFRMLPQAVWNMPEYGTFNLHASLLPDYRGAAPINWAIIKGETETGVTTFFIDDKIDTGAILLQEKTAIGPHDTAGDLHDTLMQMGARLVVATVRLIASGKAAPRPQTTSGAINPAPKLFKEDCRICWEAPMPEIYNHIRGLSPFPTAWSVLVNGGQRTEVKVFQARPEAAEHNLDPGSILFGRDRLNVAVKGGFISLLEIQLAGKRRLPVKEVLNGLQLDQAAHMV